LEVVVKSVDGGGDLTVASGRDVCTCGLRGFSPWYVESGVWGAVATLSPPDFYVAADMFRFVEAV
jgi:hypothetical protein